MVSRLTVLLCRLVGYHYYDALKLAKGWQCFFNRIMELMITSLKYHTVN